MTLGHEAAVFALACETYKNTIDQLPTDSPEREAYVEGLADGVKFMFRR